MSAQVLFHGIEAVMVLTLIILNFLSSPKLLLYRWRYQVIETAI